MRARFCVLAIATLFASVSRGNDGLAEVCARLVAEVDQRWGFAAEITQAAEARFPNDVVQRALWIQSQYDKSLASRVLPVRVKFNESTKEFASDQLVMTGSNNDIPSLRVVVDPNLQSFRYHGVSDTRLGREVEDHYRSSGHVDLRLRKAYFHPHNSSQILMSWTAGHVGLGSNSGRIASQLRFMSGVNRNSSLMGPLFDPDNPLWVESAVSAIDIPFHGAGPVTPDYFSIDKSIEFRLRYYRSLHEPKRLPLVAGGRSGENLLLAPLAFRHPELFAGMIWVSGMHPTEGYRESMQGFLDTGVLGGAPYHPMALHWFLEMHRQMLEFPPEARWWEHPAPFKMPVLVVVGSEDAQVSLATREAFRKMARGNPDMFFYVEVPGGSHDVFNGKSFRGESDETSEDDQARAAGAWQYVYWFLKSKVLGEASVREPRLGWRYQP